MRMMISIPPTNPFKPEVLKFKYVKPQNFKHGTTVE